MLFLLLAASQPFTVVDKCVWLPFIVLTVILVLAPDASSLCMVSSLAKVPWLQLSKMAYEVDFFPLVHMSNFDRKTHILTISLLHDALQLTSSNLAQLLLDVTFCYPSDALELSSPAFCFGV